MFLILAAFLLSSTSFAAGSFEPISLPPSVSLDLTNSASPSHFITVTFLNKTGSKASINDLQIERPYMVTLNRCVGVSANKPCAVTISFNGKGKAATAAPGTNYSANLTSSNSLPVTLSTNLIKEYSGPTAPSFSFVNGSSIDAVFAPNSRKSIISSIDIKNSSTFSGVPVVGLGNSGLLVILDRCKSLLKKDQSCSIYVSVPAPRSNVTPESHPLTISYNNQVQQSSVIIAKTNLAPTYVASWKAPQTITPAACMGPRSFSYEMICSDSSGSEVDGSLCATGPNTSKPNDVVVASPAGTRTINFNPTEKGSYAESCDENQIGWTFASLSCGTNYHPVGQLCEINTYQLDVQQPTLAGAITGAQSGQKTHGSQISLTAVIPNGYSFGSWSNPSCQSPTPLVCNLTMNKDEAVTFSLSLNQYFLTVIDPLATVGSISGPSSGLKNALSNLTFSAVAADGYTFDHWTANCNNGTTSPTCNITMNQSETVMASFTLNKYMLTINPPLNGQILGSTSGLKDALTTITLTSQPSTHYKLANWSGGGCTNGNVSATCEVYMNSAKSVGASFTLKNYNLTLNQTQGGTISGNSGLLIALSSHTITATPIADYSFDHWVGSCTNGTTSPTCIVTMDNDKSLSAVFTLNQYPLTITQSTGGTIGGATAGLKDALTEHTLSYSLSNGYSFSSWVGNCLNGLTSPTCVVKMTAAQNVSALYTLNNYMLSFGSMTGGSISGTTAGSKPALSSYVLTAVPAYGYVFDHWTGNCSNGTASVTCNVTMNQAETVTAAFKLDSFNLTVNQSTGGTISGATSGPKEAFSEVNLVATPQSGYTFTSWTAPCEQPQAVANNCKILMNAAKSAQALFTINKYPLTIAQPNAALGSISTNTPVGLVDHNTAVVLTYVPAISHSTYVWNGSCSTSATNSCSFLMTSANSVGVTIGCESAYHSETNSCVSDTRACSSALLSSQHVTSGTENWVSSAWSGVCVPTDSNSCSVNYHYASSSCVIDKKTLTITQPAVNSITGASSGLLDYGSQVTLSYSPVSNGTFKWIGACVDSTVSPCTFTMDSNKTVSLELGCVSGFALSGTTCQPTIPPISLTKSGEANARCAFNAAGKAYCWGLQPSSNGYFLSTGSTASPIVTPTKVLDNGTLNGKKIVQTALNARTFCVTTDDGYLYCAGNNSYYAFANGVTTNSNNAMGPAVGGHLDGKFVTDIALAYNTPCVIAYLRTDPEKKGIGYCWGYNGTDGSAAVGYTSGGTAVDFLKTPQPIAGMSGKVITQIKAGFAVSCLMAYDQSDAEKKTSLYCWGSNLYGMYGNGVTGGFTTTPLLISSGSLANKVVTDFGLGTTHVCALAYDKADLTKTKSIHCWGRNSVYQIHPSLPSMGTYTTSMIIDNVGVAGETFTKIAAGAINTCVITSAGKLYCWGANQNGQLGTGTTNATTVNVGIVQVMSDKVVSDVTISANAICALAYNTSDSTKTNAVYCSGSGMAASPILTPTLFAIPSN